MTDRRTQEEWTGRPTLFRVPETLIWRHRLDEMVDNGVRRAVTLICAGAGWGKTTLIAAWAKSHPMSPAAWLTLERHHTDLRTFWSDVVRALHDAGVPLPAQIVDAEADEELTRRIVALLHELPQTVVLILDDLHKVDDSPVSGALTHLLERAPDRLRLVLITRTEPTLPLHRLRATGELTEIRTAKLAFRVPEVAALLLLHDIRLSPDELNVLVRRTEGWAVGLRLAVDVLPDRGVAAVTGDLPAVSDYLLREVVGVLPGAMRRFLTRTSVPERINGELADVLTGGSGGQRTLEALEQANVFVTPMDPNRHWYRYHPLLLDLLRHRLRVEKPETVAGLQLSAARWYAREGATFHALRHAMAAQNWPFVGRLLISQALPLVLSARQNSLTDMFERIPSEQLGSTAELALCAATIAFFHGDFPAVPGQIARARQMLDRNATPDAKSVEMALLTLGAAATRRDGDMPRLIQTATDILERLTVLHRDELRLIDEYRAVVLGDKAVGLLWCDRLDHADRYLWAALTAARTTGLEVAEAIALGNLALLMVLEGSLTSADGYAASVRATAGSETDETGAQFAPAFLALALIQLERHNIAEAQEWLRRALHSLGQYPEPTMAVVTVVVRIHLLLARGEPATALSRLRQLHQERSPTLVAPLLDRWLLLLESDIDLAMGNGHRVIRRYSDPAFTRTPTAAEYVCLARAHLAAGELDRAEALVDHAREGPDAVSAVTAWIVTALVADARGHGNQSVDALSRAVVRAEAQGIRRPFQQFDVERLAELMQRRRWLNGAGVPAVYELVAQADSETSPDRAATPISPLSEREMDVLRYLPTVLTAAEVGSNLNISVNTVKAHMRSIYRKLGAARRREAVILARRQGLL